MVREIQKRIKPGGDLQTYRTHSEFVINAVRQALGHGSKFQEAVTTNG
jgi:hypothetical protein